MHQSRCDGRAIDHACSSKKQLVLLAFVIEGAVDKRQQMSLHVQCLDIVLPDCARRPGAIF